MVVLDPTRPPDLIAAAIQTDVLPTKDGVHRVRVTLDDSRVLLLSLPGLLAADMIRTMQANLIPEASTGASDQMPHPMPVIVGRSIMGHGEAGPGVLVETDSLGMIALMGTSEALQSLMTETGRALEVMSMRSKPAN